LKALSNRANGIVRPSEIAHGIEILFLPLAIRTRTGVTGAGSKSLGSKEIIAATAKAWVTIAHIRRVNRHPSYLGRRT